MEQQAVKQFEVEHGSTPASHYQILIRFRGVIVENICLPTMQGALEEMERRGYYFTNPRRDGR